MAGRMKFNPSTGRWETAVGIDNPPSGQWINIGETYVDEVTGQTKRKNAGWQRADDIIAEPTTTTAAPKGEVVASVAPPKGSTQVTTPNVPREQLPTKASTEKIREQMEVPKIDATVSKAVQDALNSGDIARALELINALNPKSGSGAASARAQAAANAANYQALIKSSKEQAATGSKAIQDATKQYLASLPSSMAYEGLPSTQVPVAEQGLGQALANYGATGQMAAGQKATDEAVSRQLADLQARSMAQLGQAEKGYRGALTTSAQGAQAAALQELQRQMVAQQMQAGLKYGVPKKKK